MNHLVLAPSMFAALSVVFLTSVEAGQQNVPLVHQPRLLRKQSHHQEDKKCLKILSRKDSPDEQKPFKIEGCTTDMIFTRGRCDNKCYDDRRVVWDFEGVRTQKMYRAPKALQTRGLRGHAPQKILKYRVNSPNAVTYDRKSLKILPISQVRTRVFA